MVSLNDPRVVSVFGVRFGVCVCMSLRGPRFLIVMAKLVDPKFTC